MRWLVHTLTLSYGGVALLAWLQHTLAGPQALPPVDTAGWLRDGTLLLPVVALAVFLGSGRPAAPTQAVPGGVAALFAVIMGVGTLLHSADPQHAGMDMGSGGFSSLAVGQHFVLTLVVAWAYATVVGRALILLGTGIEDHLAAPHLPRRLVSAVWMGVTVLAVVPATLLLSTGHAVAQTSFPDHTIHPHGQLTLIARRLDDNSMAYVAPEYGPDGTRPTIEMTEGETLNITLINALDSDVSLHVHGVLYNPDSDGTRQSNSFVRPGEQRVYQWRAAVGTAGYWPYHDHVMGDNAGTAGISGGLYGGLIVRKPGDLTPARTADPDPTNPANLGSGHEDNHILAPGDSFGFLTIAGQGVGPGMWMYHCHVQSHSGGMMGFFNVLPAEGYPSPKASTP